MSGKLLEMKLLDYSVPDPLLLPYFPRPPNHRFSFL